MPTIIDVNAIDHYKPLPKVRIWHKSKALFKIIVGGFGSGKTKALNWEAIDESMKYPNNRWLLARDTTGDLADSTQHDFLQDCPPELIKSYHKKEGRVTLVNNSEVIFRSFRSYYESVHSQKQSRLKALNLGGAGVDEISETAKDKIEYLKARLRLPNIPDEGHKLIGVTNPPDKNHWLFKTFDGKTDPSNPYLFMQQCSARDNPYLPEDYVANLERDYPPSWVARFIDGSFGFVLKGDPVYEGFIEKMNGLPWHCGATQFLRGRPVYRDWDFGWHHPAVVWSQEDLEGRWRIHKELMGERVYIWDFAPQVMKVSNAMFPGAEFIDYCDPAGVQKSDRAKRSTISILNEDFHIHPLFRVSHVKDGVDIIQRKLSRVVAGEPDIMINEAECPILHDGFLGGYARAKPTDGTQMKTWEPMKDGYYEHVFDAIRMGAINRYSSGHSQTRGNFKVGGPGWRSAIANKVA